jgi:hypothetical protein
MSAQDIAGVDQDVAENAAIAAGLRRQVQLDRLLIVRERLGELALAASTSP